jgi:CRP/FNR family cyclic AMP-dependent transcriptional regulator
MSPVSFTNAAFPPGWNRPVASLRDSEFAAFRRSAWFGALPSQLQGAMMARSTVWTVPARRTVCEQGAVPDVWFGLVSGAIRLSSLNSRGADTLLDVVEPGHWFGESALLEALAQPFAARTLAPSIVMVMRKSTLQDMLAQHAEMRSALTRLNWISTARLGERLSLLAERTLETRTKDYLSVLSRRFNASTPGADMRPLSLTQTDWGAMLGVSRQRANGILRKLASSGVIKLKGGRVVPFAQEP